MKDHEKAALVNELTALAKEFGGAQQLRERIAHCVLPALDRAVSDERGACAKVCEKFTNSKSGHPFPEGWDAACAQNAADIRMRSNSNSTTPPVA